MLEQKLDELIIEGEKVKKFCYHTNEFGDYLNGVEYETWISKCTLFLNSNFPNNELISKFKQAANDAVGNGLDYFHTKIGVLIALKDYAPKLVTQQQTQT